MIFHFSDGWHVARAARKADPSFPVIYMSGVAADQWPEQGVPTSILLQKPFAGAQLVTALTPQNEFQGEARLMRRASLLLVEDEAFIQMMPAEMAEEGGLRHGS